MKNVRTAAEGVEHLAKKLEESCNQAMDVKIQVRDYGESSNAEVVKKVAKKLPRIV